MGQQLIRASRRRPRGLGRDDLDLAIDNATLALIGIPGTLANSISAQGTVSFPIPDLRPFLFGQTLWVAPVGFDLGTAKWAFGGEALPVR